MIAQIEVNNFCNHKCWYCQNAYFEPPKPKVMSMQLFDKILHELRDTYDKSQLNVISFASYNEPTLDPYFKDRLRLLTKMGFYYWFISNGSNITKDLVDFLIKEKVLLTNIHINLPAIDPDEYYDLVKNNAEYIFKIRKQLIYLFENKDKLKIPISIVVHGDGSQRHINNFNRMKEFFGTYNVEISYCGLVDRAGMLKNVIKNNIDHKNKKLICRVNYFNNIYIGVDGNIYLCCHDFYQKFSYANINDDKLSNLLKSKERQDMIKNMMKKMCRYCTMAEEI